MANFRVESSIELFDNSRRESIYVWKLKIEVEGKPPIMLQAYAESEYEGQMRIAYYVPSLLMKHGVLDMDDDDERIF